MNQILEMEQQKNNWGQFPALDLQAYMLKNLLFCNIQGVIVLPRSFPFALAKNV